MTVNKSEQLRTSFSEPTFIKELSTHLRGTKRNPDDEPESRVVEYVTLSIQGAINSSEFLGNRDPVDVVMIACAKAYVEAIPDEPANDTKRRILLLHRAVIKELVKPPTKEHSETEPKHVDRSDVFTRADGTRRDFIGSLDKKPN
ncbi:MAG: hypothetical protein QF793_03855 [Candidatus Peribacteraceae bacterium]|nr:hypothetical protein [Candidatus Peribacteraceae bacterium]